MPSLCTRFCPDSHMGRVMVLLQDSEPGFASPSLARMFQTPCLVARRPSFLSLCLPLSKLCSSPLCRSWLSPASNVGEKSCV